MIPSDGKTDEEILEILKLKRIAVVGMSRDPSKDAHMVPKYLIEKGYRVYPVNPFAEEILGLKSYKSLLDIPEEIDIVNIFRPSEQVYPIVKDAVKKGAKVIWMQLGIYNKEAVEYAKKHGLEVVWNRCIYREHRRLMG